MKYVILLALVLSSCTLHNDEPEPGYIYRVDEYGKWERFRPVTEQEIILNQGVLI